MTELLDAIKLNQIDSVEYLIDECDVHQLNEALRYASFYGNQEIIDILLSYDIEFNIEEAMIYAAYGEQYEIVEYLENKTFIVHLETIIMNLVFQKQWNAANWFIERATQKGCDLAWNEMLYNAAFKCHKNAVHYFLQRGADPMYGKSGVVNGMNQEINKKRKYKSIRKIIESYKK